MRALRLLLLAVVLGLPALCFWGCGSGPTPRPEEQDAAPVKPVDLSHVQDAVPRVEPRSKYGNPPSYEVLGRTYRVMDSSSGYQERGIASWYGTKFHGRRTSSGEPYDMYGMTAAHKTLPLPTYVRVTNLENGRSAILKVNDRGPFHQNRIIDLSYAAATKLGVLGRGTAMVEVTALEPGRTGDPESRPALASGGMFLQTGAFSSVFNARRQKEMVARVSKEPVRIETVRRAEGEVHRVQLGPLYNVDQVDQLSQALADLGIMDTTVIIP